MVRENYILVIEDSDLRSEIFMAVSKDELDKKANEALKSGDVIQLACKVSELYEYVAKEKVTVYVSKKINI